MLKLQATSKFRKDYKRIKKRGLDISSLQEVLDKLCAGEALDLKHKDHALTGSYQGFRECHSNQTGFLFMPFTKTSLYSLRLVQAVMLIYLICSKDGSLTCTHLISF